MTTDFPFTDLTDNFKFISILKVCIVWIGIRNILGYFLINPMPYKISMSFFLQWKIQFFEENISGFYLHLMDFNFNFNSVSCYCFLKKKKNSFIFHWRKTNMEITLGWV